MFIINNCDLSDEDKKELHVEFKRVMTEANESLGELHSQDWVTSTPVFLEALTAVTGKLVGEVMPPQLVLKVTQTFLQAAFMAISDKEIDLIDQLADDLLAETVPENDQPC